MGELVAFCGLSARPFFNPIGYANRDAFRLVVQNFDDPTQGILMLSRRRDGSRRSFVSRSAALFLRPPHVDAGLNAEIDAPFLRGLLGRSAEADWGRFDEAIQLFNNANTDSPDVLPETEAVNLVGAFERLFDLSRGKEDELAEHFVSAFKPYETLTPANSPRVLTSVNPAKYTKWTSMREVWIRDLFQLRGQHAHGKIAPKMVSLWPLHEHLLLAAFIFPLVVKCHLWSEKRYEMTASDAVHLDVFEALLEADHVAIEPHPWHEIIDEARTRRWVAECTREAEDSS